MAAEEAHHLMSRTNQSLQSLSMNELHTQKKKLGNKQNIIPMAALLSKSCLQIFKNTKTTYRQ